MPYVFHTKTIQSILDPVAQQVLYILVQIVIQAVFFYLYYECMCSVIIIAQRIMICDNSDTLVL